MSTSIERFQQIALRAAPTDFAGVPTTNNRACHTNFPAATKVGGTPITTGIPLVALECPTSRLNRLEAQPIPQPSRGSGHHGLPQSEAQGAHSALLCSHTLAAYVRTSGAVARVATQGYRRRGHAAAPGAASGHAAAPPMSVMNARRFIWITSSAHSHSGRPPNMNTTPAQLETPRPTPPRYLV